MKKDERSIKREISEQRKSVRIKERILAQAEKKKNLTSQKASELQLARFRAKELISYLTFLQKTYKESRPGMMTLQRVAKKKLRKIRGRLKGAADVVLKKRVKRMVKELAAFVDNNELLRFEIFSGSGENIRFLSAAGKREKNRVPSSVKPKSKDLQWNFDGEYWEDEIGFYKSRIENVCRNQKSSAR
jgi:hypothetical protein